MNMHMRRDARQIFERALAAAQPTHLFSACLRLEGDRLLAGGHAGVDLGGREQTFVLGFGKAAPAMARALAERLAPRRLAGFLVTKPGHGEPVPGCQVQEAGHPVPDARSAAAAEAALHWLDRSVPADAPVIVLVSGGASALLCLPAGGVTVTDKAALTELLLACGADIGEINCVRKHLSAVKGGQLARRLGRRPALTLALSDVVGDRLDTIGSGPTVADTSSFADAWAILEKYQLALRVPSGVRRHLEAGLAGQIPETVRPDDPVLANKSAVVAGNNMAACHAAKEAARQLGYRPLLVSDHIAGDTAHCSAFHSVLAQDVVYAHRPAPPPICLISGGETTVRLKGGGLGGRNMEFVLHCVRRLAGCDVPAVVFSAGTDGTDGPTDAAGALADNGTLARALALGLDPDDYLSRNDSYRFFQPLGDLVVTGPTGTNVMDIRLVLIGEPVRSATADPGEIP
jgi:hydroxypyruvate reductase